MKNIILYGMLLCYSSLFSQIKIIKDEALRQQEGRMVFQEWGDPDNWKPEAEYYKIFGTRIGPNLSYKHSLVWGMLAPSANKRYKRGSDIRPLRVGGEETQRQVATHAMEAQAKQVREHVQTLKKRSTDDMTYWTPTTINADPLYLLYYKRMLTPLKNFPDHPTWRNWGFPNKEAYKRADRIGQIDELRMKLHSLKDTYKTAMTLPMPRGKRFLLYHKALLGWRELQVKIANCNRESRYSIDSKDLLDQQKNAMDKVNLMSDLEIAKQVIQQYKHKF
jgi:hypothetical protein